jgi:hypothetical protein
MPEQNPFDQFDDTGSISTITDAPIPSGEEKIAQSAQAVKDIAAGAVRYGIPTAGALATGGLTTIPSLLVNAGIVGASEFSARQIERIGSDPKIDEIWNDLKASATAGAIDLGVGGALAGVGRGITSVARRALLPREIPGDVELAQSILGRLSKSGKAAAKKWKIFKGKDPFSLTLGQLNRDERGFVTFLEGVARGGSGGGVMTKFDNRNIKHVEEALTKYFDSVTAQRSGPEMGAFFKRMFGFDVDSPIDIFKPVEAYRAYLYKRYDKALAQYSDVPIDGTKLREFFKKSTDQDMIKIYSQLRATDLVPPLEGIPNKVTRATRSTARRVTSAATNDIADVTRTDLLKKAHTPKRTLTQTEASRAGEAARTVETQTTREILADPRALKSEVDKSWKNLSPEQVDSIIRNINDFYSATDDKFNKRLMFLKSQIEAPYEKFLVQNPELQEIRKTANSFFGQKEDALYNATMMATRKALKKSPSGVVQLFDPLKGNVAHKYDNLMSLKDGIFFSAATPPVAVSKNKTILATGTEKVRELYENSILQPLRFRFVDAATNNQGLLDGASLLKNIEKIEAEAPEMLNELWGSPQAVKNIRELASTLNTLQTSSPDKSIFIQLKTAAALGTVGGGMWSYFNGDNPAVGGATGAAVGAATILLAPRMLARTLSNPTITRALTDGITDSVKFRGVSPKLAIIFRKMAEMYPVSKMFRDETSTDSQQFYNFAPIQQEPAQ